MTITKYNRVVEIHEELKELNERFKMLEKTASSARSHEELDKVRADYAKAQKRILELFKEIERL